MTIDFTTMDGYEFEDYISNLFRGLGFEVEATNYSNDGGIDLVATYSQPIFAGKYIIQCKKWTGPVGQPEVRDLYGVVMDCRANKGIIITPSDYTQQAYDFAKGKNIELINGVILRKIVGNISEINEVSQFKQNDVFRNEQYTYLKKNITEEPNVDSHYLQMINYLREYLKKQDVSACTTALFEEIIQWTDQLIVRCYKTPSKLNDRQIALMLKAEAYIHTGKLAEATEILLKSNHFWLRNTYAGTNSEAGGRISHVGCFSLISWNLYAAYKHINYEKGCDLLISQFVKPAVIEPYFGKLFVYPKGKISSTHNGKTKHIYLSSFYEDEIADPTYFYSQFYLKTAQEYAKEIDAVFKLHGIL